MKKQFYNLFFGASFCVFALATTQSHGQLIVDNTATATQMVATLLGPGVTASNITSTCATNQWGIFSNGSTTSLGINGGIVLTSGTAVGLGNPASNFSNSATGQPGDADLTTYGVTPVGTTWNACILEFDAIPICDTIRFRYRFASEEYPEWVNTSFADAFAFFISGPGLPVGTNIAKIPVVNQPVNINTVNAGNFGCPGPATGCTNCVYYVNTCTGTNIVYDGMTTLLTAEAIVTACSTYHIKLSIADRADQIFDSGVFLEQGTLACSGFSFEAVGGADTLIESCQNADIQVCHFLSTAVPHTVHFTIGGTATMGVDYANIPDSITIPAGTNCTSLQFNVFTDAFSEGSESIYLVYQPNACSPNDTLGVWIVDPDSVQPSPDVVTCSNTPVQIGIAPVPGFFYAWSPSGGLDNDSIAQPTLTMANSTGVNVVYQYILTATAGTCIDKDTILATIFPGPLANAGANVTFCTGFAGTIGVPATAGDVYSWSPATGLSSTTVANPQVTTTNPGGTPITVTYVLNVTNASLGCPQSDTVTVTVSPITPTNINNYNPMCQDAGNLFLFGSTPFGGSYSGPGVTGSTFNPNAGGPGSYYIYYTFTNTFGCVNIDSSLMTVYPLPTVDPGATLNVCIGGDVPMSATGSSNIMSWSWSPTSFLNDPTIPNPTAVNPNPPGIYVYTISVVDSNTCTFDTTKTIIVNALPPVSAGSDISVCIGNSVNINGSGASVYVWTPTTDLSDPNVPNPVSSTLSTITYTLTGTDINNCVNSDAMTVNVNPLPVMGFASIGPFCFDAPLHTMNEGTPANGVYSGPGVTTSPEFSPAMADVGTHTLKYVYVNPVTGCTDSINQTVVVNPLPEPVFITNPTMTTLSNAVISFDDLTASAVNWNWVFGDGDSIAGIGSPSHTYNDTGNFTITLTVFNEFGCLAQTQDSIHIEADLQFFIPTAFSPNGDGNNDSFHGGSGVGFHYFFLSIYDRWGNRVFESTDYAKGWDGTGAPAGSYIYKVNLKDFNNKDYEYVGHISLLR